MRARELYENDSKHFQTLQKTGFWGKQGAGCIFVAQDTGNIGVALRSSYVQSPNTIGTIGGAIDSGEDPAESTKREVKEEVGYTGQLKLTPLLTSKLPTKDGGTFTYYNYLAIVPNEFKGITNWENDALLWMSLDELKSQPNLHRGLKLLLNDQQSLQKIQYIIQNTNNKVDEQVLTEGATDELFFYRRLRGALGILNDGKFTFSSATGNSVEEKWQPAGKPYFLSTTRTKHGDYHRYVGDSAAMFNLDGRWIGQRYTVKPIDYWEGMHRNPASGRTREAEDRIYSANPYMPLTPITSIHLYVNMSILGGPEQDGNLNYRDRDRLVESNEIIKLARSKNIPVYFYASEQRWRMQDISKSLHTDEQLNRLLKQTENFNLRTSDYKPTEWLSRWVELIQKNKKEDLSPDADKMRYNMMYYSDTYQGLANDMHNARKPGSADFNNVVLINQYMVKNKLRTIKDLVLHLMQKWGAITQ